MVAPSQMRCDDLKDVSEPRSPQSGGRQVSVCHKKGHNIFKKLDELSVRGKESKSRHLDTPSVGLCVGERHISFMFQVLSAD